MQEGEAAQHRSGFFFPAVNATSWWSPFFPLLLSCERPRRRPYDAAAERNGMRAETKNVCTNDVMADVMTWIGCMCSLLNLLYLVSFNFIEIKDVLLVCSRNLDVTYNFIRDLPCLFFFQFSQYFVFCLLNQ